MKTYLLLLTIILLAPLTQAASELQTYRTRYTPPLLNMVDQDSLVLDRFHTDRSSSIALEELKHALTLSDSINTKAADSSASSATKQKQSKPTQRQQGFVLSASATSQSKPAGQVANYHFAIQPIAQWQGKICLSLASSLPGANLSKTSVLPNETFTLEVPTHDTTQWGNYMFTVTATAENGALVKQRRVNLKLLPSNVKHLTRGNATWLPIADNTPKGAQSAIYVPEMVSTFGVSVSVKIDHPWHSDLQLTLISPSGTSHRLNKTGTTFVNNQYQEYHAEAFTTEPAQGNWVLNVADLAASDSGMLRGWRLHISGYPAAKAPQNIITP